MSHLYDLADAIKDEGEQLRISWISNGGEDRKGAWYVETTFDKIGEHPNLEMALKLGQINLPRMIEWDHDMYDIEGPWDYWLHGITNLEEQDGTE